MKNGFSIILFCLVIFFIIKMILSDTRLQGKLLGLAAFALAGVILAGVIHLVSKIFKQLK